MHLSFFWITVLLTISVTVQSSSAAQLVKRQAGPECFAKKLDRVDILTTADEITIIPPPFNHPEECRRKGEYEYRVSWGVKGTKLQTSEYSVSEERLRIPNLQPSTTYTVKVLVRYTYKNGRAAHDAEALETEGTTSDLAVPPDPTKEITLVDSSQLNKTQQEFEFPLDMFSNINGAVHQVDMLVAQDTEIGNCEDPIKHSWKVAQSHSPIKCYNAGHATGNEVGPSCRHVKDDLRCVLGYEKECDEYLCNGALTPGVKYGLKLRAYNAAGSTDSKPVFFTAGGSPGAPGGASATSGTFSLIGAITVFILVVIK